MHHNCTCLHKHIYSSIYILQWSIYTTKIQSNKNPNTNPNTLDLRPLHRTRLPYPYPCSVNDTKTFSKCCPPDQTPMRDNFSLSMLYCCISTASVRVRPPLQNMLL